MRKPDFNDQTLWIAYLDSQLTKSDVFEFESWLKNHPEEKIEFDQFKRIWEAGSNLKIPAGLNSERRWQRIESKIDSSDKARKQPIYYWAVAAIVLISFSFLWFSSSVISFESKYGEHKIVYLPDSSKVTLNAGSKLVYNPENWFAKRFVRLSGEAYFEVKKGKSFSVQTDYSITQVLGTTFNIKQSNNLILIACLTGKVSVSNNHFKDHEVILLPGLASNMEPNRKAGIPYRYNPEQIVSWLDNQFYFSQTPISLVFEEVERQFDVEIELDEQSKTKLFSGKFSKVNIEETLESICLSSGLKFELDESGVYRIK